MSTIYLFILKQNLGKSRQTSSVCWPRADNKLNKPKLIRDQEAGMTEGERVQWQSAAPTVTPLAFRKHPRALTRVVGWWCDCKGRGPWRKQVSLPSLSQLQEKTHHNPLLKKTVERVRRKRKSDSFTLTKRKRKEIQGGEKLKGLSVSF